MIGVVTTGDAGDDDGESNLQACPASWFCLQLIVQSWSDCAATGHSSLLLMLRPAVHRLGLRNAD